MFVLLFYGFFLIYIGTGVYQPLNAIYHLTTPEGKSERFNSGIKKYLLGVLLYSVILALAVYLDFGGQLALIYLFGIPWIFIFWFYNLKLELKKAGRQIDTPFDTLDDLR